MSEIYSFKTDMFFFMQIKKTTMAHQKNTGILFLHLDFIFIFITLYTAYCKMKRSFNTRIRAVEDYMKGGTLKEVSSRYNIHFSTLSRWVKWYERLGEEETYPRPWNRTSREKEERVAGLKEKNPSLTLKRTSKILQKEGISISLRGIRNIWKRYNLLKRAPDDPFSSFAIPTPETRCALEYVKSLLKKDRKKETLKKSASILNGLPSYPVGYDEVIQKIPPEHLSLHRKLDYMNANFMQIPEDEFLKEVRNIRVEMEKRNYLYSSILAGISEMLILHWMGLPEDILNLYSVLEKRKGSLREPIMNFCLSFMAATANSELYKYRKAKKYTTRCKRILKNNPHPFLLQLYGDVMSFMGKNDESLNFYIKALNKTRNDDLKRTLIVKVASGYIETGEYREADKTFESLKMRQVQMDNVCKLHFYIGQAFLNYALGKFEQLSFYIEKAFEYSEEHQVRNYLFASSICHAIRQKALGRKIESKNILKKYLPVIEKKGGEREIKIIKFLLRKKVKIDEKIKEPILHLLWLLKKATESLKVKDYRKATGYARKNGLSGYLHRFVVFFPEPVFNLLKKNRNTELPESILQFPIFKKIKTVFHLEFLGELSVYRGEEKIEVNLSPKDTSFLIHLALRAGEPDKRIPLKKIYENFWKKSSRQSRNLSHLLVRIRKELGIPSNFLEFSRDTPTPSLINRKIHFTTDYGDFKRYITRAKALEKADEWEIAAEQYWKAFSLFRGKPFEKMYDNWSEDKRIEIIFSFEDEVIEFSDKLLSRGLFKEAQSLLKTLKEVIPQSTVTEGIKDKLK